MFGEVVTGLALCSEKIISIDHILHVLTERSDLHQNDFQRGEKLVTVTLDEHEDSVVDGNLDSGSLKELTLKVQHLMGKNELYFQFCGILSTIYGIENKYSLKEELISQRLKFYRGVYGREHPKTLNTLTFIIFSKGCILKIIYHYIMIMKCAP